MTFAALLALTSFAAGCLGAASLLRGGFALALLCHAAAAVLGRHAALISDSRRLGMHSFQTAFSLCVPFFGGCAAFFLSEAVKRKKTGALADDFAVYLNDAASFRESVPVTDAEAPSPDELVPLADILANPVSEAEQRIAVENLAGMETPAAMEILRGVIDADSGEGRFFAMTALGQMEEKLLFRLQRLEEDIASGRFSGTDILRDAARTYLDFSYYQLAQEARRADYLERAGELLEQALEDPECDDDAWILLGRVRLLRADAREAMKCFDAYVGRNPEEQLGYLWRAEAWFELREFGLLRTDCRRAMDLGPLPGNISGAVLFWLGEDRRQSRTTRHIRVG